MPPKTKITKEMILNAILEITQETGFEDVNARSIASKLQCSTRPMFTCYENMEELKKDFLDFAYKYYTQYVSNYSMPKNTKPYLLLPLSYIAFAKEETQLFKLLFIDDMDLDMIVENDFYNEIGNIEKAKTFSNMIGVELESAKKIFLDLFLYSHGIAVLTATGKMSLNSDIIEKMIINVLSAFIEKEKGNFSK